MTGILVLSSRPFLCTINCMNYTYIVECADHSLYTGWTNHLEKRMKAHNDGQGAKYTKGRRPIKLVYYEEYETKQEAMQREYAIKHLSKKEKERLIQSRQIETNLKIMDWRI